uniref:2Fe-2S ferredoxin-type domain-containing protein n=1 Tax=Trichobilharzia regenti TaxID=157069 RepID=A0AA85IZ21_TRIRE|nr:unnamed protein product [Trichobilharzia regenti]
MLPLRWCAPLICRKLVVFRLIRSIGSQQRKRQSVNVTFAWKDGNQKTVPAKIGDTFLDVVLDNDVDIDGFGACEGTLACSTCHLIFPKEHYDKLRDPLTDEEQDLLDLAYSLTETSRLGCQIKVSEDMDGLVVSVPESIYDARN